MRDREDIREMLLFGTPFNRFGFQMIAHQNRVARDGAAFLRFLGYSERAAKNFRAAMLFHDIGKMDNSYDYGIWTLRDRPTPEQKDLQRRHARLGAESWEAFASDKPDLLAHPHYAVRYGLTRYHHERFDSKGPDGLDASSLPVFIQVSCIIDAYDGDRIQRGHQKAQRTPAEALKRLAGIGDPKQKYAGAFDKKLLSQYTRMKQKQK